MPKKRPANPAQSGSAAVPQAANHRMRVRMRVDRYERTASLSGNRNGIRRRLNATPMDYQISKCSIS